jgi:Na+-transporting NADH:ubiquinone oxidoreductase subunit NqrB
MSTDITARPATAMPTAAPKKQGGWFTRFKPFLAPILISCILAAGNYQYGVLEGNWGTVAAILTSIIAETVLSLFATGRWPHIASAYITGISVGILLRTPLLWPYIMCSLLSISSKYALRVGGRHLWNPSNLGVSVLLFLAPATVAPLSQQWGNEIWVPIIILGLGMLILYTLGRLHITLTFIVAFSVFAYVRHLINGVPWITQVGQLTSPGYLLFMCFMITDPKTTTRTKLRQCVVTIVVATVDTLFHLADQVHAPYYALFWVFPAANLLEIGWDRWQARNVHRLAMAAACNGQGAVLSDGVAAPPRGQT